MKTFFQKRKLKILFFITPLYVFSKEIYPPIVSTYHLRIVNRRFVSHIVFESIENKKYLTIILTHGPNYWAYKSNSYRLFYECETSKQCIDKAKQLDQFLQNGYNIAFYIKGDQIQKIIFLDPTKLD